MTTHPFDADARGATIALTRALNQRCAACGRRAALRAGIVARCLDALGADDATRALCLATTLTAEVGVLVDERTVTEAALDPLGLITDAAVLLVDCPGLEEVAVAVYHQFERVDGSGHPHGLIGDDIPLAARLHAIAACLTSSVEHPRDSIAWKPAIELMKDLAGAHLDLRLTDVCYHATLSEARRSRIDTLDVDGAGRLLPDPEPRAPRGATSSLVRARALIRSVPRPGEVLGLLAEDAVTSLGALGVGIGALRPGQDQLDLIASAGTLPPSLQTLPVHPALLSAASPATTSSTVRMEAPGVGSVLAATVPGLTGPWGVVWAISGAGQDFSPDAGTELVTLAHAIADAVAQGTSIGQLVDAATIDALTQVRNRRCLDQRLGDLFARDPDERADTALVMCDVDGLKRVNDLKGHEAGDEVLVAAAAALTEVASGHPDAEVFRLGGDEFCILVPRGGLLAGEDIALAADTAVRAGTDGKVSASCGVGYGIQATSPAELLRRADEAQYIVKRSRTSRPRGAPRDTTPGRRGRRDA